ncbi:hypothetical protein [Devosia sp. 2618]|uniref:hypothetical protein n=1 Tax=Devosia sp. 2618 TaxID=3156454 RepID=UPI0033952268
MPSSFSHLLAGTSLMVSVALFSGAALADPIDDRALAFVSTEHAEVLPLQYINEALDDMVDADPTAMIPADADISPIEKALLLIDTQEEPLPRARYVLRYNREIVDGVELSLVAIDRYNLGPAIRAETALSYGEENTANAEEFGIGPHVRWRFATQPTAKLAALLLAASREEISEKQAKRGNCFGRTCLSLDPLDVVADWAEWTQYETPLPEVVYPTVLSNLFNGEATELAPALVALETAQAAGLADGLAWTLPEKQGGDNDTPFIVVIVDRNLGQEVMSDVALGVAKMGLDSEEHWTRISGGIFDGVPTQNLTTAEGPLK